MSFGTASSLFSQGNLAMERWEVKDGGPLALYGRYLSGIAGAGWQGSGVGECFGERGNRIRGARG